MYSIQRNAEDYTMISKKSCSAKEECRCHFSSKRRDCSNYSIEWSPVTCRNIRYQRNLSLHKGLSTMVDYYIIVLQRYMGTCTHSFQRYIFRCKAIAQVSQCFVYWLQWVMCLQAYLCRKLEGHQKLITDK